MSRFRIAISIVLFCLALCAQAATDTRGSSDHPLLERYPRAWIVNFDQLEAPDYRWVLGALEKVNGVLSTEQEQRLPGLLTRISYRIPPGVTAQQAFAYVQAQLEAGNAQLKFQCQGRACGSSNEWANKIFGYAKLYGVERSQSYAAWQLNNTMVSLYSVQRGNKRVYLHLDLLEQKAPDQVQRLQREGYVRWPQGVEQDEMLAYLASSHRMIWLVGHQQGVGEADVLQAQSRQMAEAVAQQLREAGVASERLQVFGAGALAPGLVAEGESAVFVIERP